MRLKSNEDPSINFIEEALTGFLESRYVRKCEAYFICYLSSQSGCSRGCKFCHLTTTKQTKSDDVRPAEYLSQAQKVLRHYEGQSKADYVHFNFMARGEALANKYLINEADEILYELGRLVHKSDPGLSVRFNVSTIMPRDLDRPLEKIFKSIHPTIYYSLYSMNPKFRRYWMPNAMPAWDALGMLKSYQDFSKKKIKIHHCFIKGENDSEEDVKLMIQSLDNFNLDYEFNLVRYNPYSEAQGEESSEETIARNMSIISQHTKTKVIPRVGYDVKASCGMFVENENKGYIQKLSNLQKNKNKD